MSSPSAARPDATPCSASPPAPPRTASIRLHREGGLAFSDVVTFNLDEYVPMAPDDFHSYHRFMWENLFAHVDIDPRNVHIPRGDLPRGRIAAHCREYEQAIREAGGIDF